MASEVAVTGRNLPALAATPALDIGAEDVALPRLYIGQFSSPFVQDELVGVGDLFIATGKDDTEPRVIAKRTKKEGINPDDGPLFHVLGLWRGKSHTVNGELFTYAYNDPSAPNDAWTTYNYTLAIPDVDADVPIKFLMTRSNTPAAKTMNMILMRNQAAGPSHELAFRLGSRFGENDKGKWYSAQIRQVEAPAASVAVAGDLAAMVLGGAPSVEAAATGEDPAI